MIQCCGDVTLSDALSDPIVQAFMAADHVDPAELEADLLALVAELDLELAVRCTAVDREYCF
jgi:hypothetical protein